MFRGLPEAEQRELGQHVERYLRELAGEPEVAENLFLSYFNSSDAGLLTTPPSAERIGPRLWFARDDQGRWSALKELNIFASDDQRAISSMVDILSELADLSVADEFSPSTARRIRDIKKMGPNLEIKKMGPNLNWLTNAGVGVFFSLLDQGILVLLCGPEASDPPAILFEEASTRSLQLYSSENADTLLPEDVEQRPAAYRFTIRGDKLDILPELPEPENRQFAADTYEELIAKARELLDRLKQTNSPARVCHSIERLLSALGTQFDELRLGLLLSRARSIEADRAAFDTDESRGELFSDAFAMIDDTLQSLRDLLAVFPIVRRIEAERLALDLDRNPETVPVIRERMEEIQQEAKQSEAATKQALGALGQNDAAIEDATDPVLRTSLVADKLLVVRNFLSAAASVAAKELSEVAGPSWAAIKAELPKGIGAATRVAPFMGLIAFIGWAAGPVAGIASVVPAFKPIAAAFGKLADSGQADPAKPLSGKFARKRTPKSRK
jgi:hypothetical protein